MVMISSSVYADEGLPGIKQIPGYVCFPEDVYILLMDEYQTLEYENTVLKQDNKWLIQENERLEKENAHFSLALNEERKAAQLAMNNLESVVEKMSRQIEDLKMVYEYNQTTLWNKAKLVGGGALVATLLYQYAKMLKASREPLPITN